MTAPWPEFDPALNFPAEDAEMEKVMELITGIRTRRSEMNVPPSRKAQLHIETKDPALYQAEAEAIQRLAGCSGVEVGESMEVPKGAVTMVTTGARSYLPLEDLIDRDAELARLEKELKAQLGQLERAEAKLSNEKFMSKAPADVVEGVRANCEKLRENVKHIQESLKGLQG